MPQLAWPLKNVSSLVQGSRAVTVHAQPGTYNPTTSRLVKIHLADSSSWAELGSLKFCFELVNKSETAPFEFLGNPLIAFDQYRLAGGNLKTVHALIKGAFRESRLKLGPFNAFLEANNQGRLFRATRNIPIFRFRFATELSGNLLWRVNLQTQPIRAVQPFHQDGERSL